MCPLKVLESISDFELRVNESYSNASYEMLERSRNFRKENVRSTLSAFKMS